MATDSEYADPHGDALPPVPHGAPLSDYDDAPPPPPPQAARIRRRPLPRARDSDNEDADDAGRPTPPVARKREAHDDVDVLDLIAETVEAPHGAAAGGFGRPAAASEAPPDKRARVDASAARGAAVAAVMFDEEATRYRDKRGRVTPDATQAARNFRRTQFRLRVRSHPVPQFLDKVHAFTSRATRSYTFSGGAFSTTERTGEDTGETGDAEAYSRRREGASMAPEGVGGGGGGDEDDGGGPDPGHDITGIMRIDPLVFGNMQAALLLVATRMPGVTAEALVCSNEHVQTIFARLTACLFLLDRYVGGAVSVPPALVRTVARTRDDMLRWLAQHARLDARSGRVLYYPTGVRGGGRASTQGDYARTPFMRWDAETGYRSVDGNAGLPPPAPPGREAADDPLRRVRAYLPHNASREY